MSAYICVGLDGGNPLHALAAFGLLRLADRMAPGARLGWRLEQAAWRPVLSTIDDPEEQYYESILKFSVVDDNRSQWVWKTGEGEEATVLKDTGLVTQGTLGSLFKNGDDTYGVLFYTTDDAGETLHGEWLYMGMGNNDVEDFISVDECTRSP